MEKYRYYTPVDLARSILNVLPDIDIETIVDICCGSWNLLQAGKERYPHATVTGVDIDVESEKYKIVASNFKVMDGREFAKKEYELGNTYDLILSNPPFGYLEECERKFGAKDIGYGDVQVSYLNKRYECEMVQANFLLSHDKSVLVFILPHTFVAGTSFKKIRCQIANMCTVKAIVKLPITTFSKGRINTFAIVLCRATQKCSTSIYNATNIGEWRICREKEVSEEEIKEGKWWEEKGKRNPNNNIQVLRGTISSEKFIECGNVVLHCGKKSKEGWLPSRRYYDASKTGKNEIVVQKGDVLVNRIGKAAGYWCISKFDNVLISDCLLVIKNTTQEIINILKKNSDCEGRLMIPLRGVATSYITREDLVSLFDEMLGDDDGE